MKNKLKYNKINVNKLIMNGCKVVCECGVWVGGWRGIGRTKENRQLVYNSAIFILGFDLSILGRDGMPVSKLIKETVILSNHHF